jgi:hypothetical protein
MRLTGPDKIEFLKAALKTTDRAMGDWIVSLVDALDALPEGKTDVPCPSYRPVKAAENGTGELFPLAG